jgi:hypothetical protein
MTSILPTIRLFSVRAAAGLLVAVVSQGVGRAANACETTPDLHVEVTAQFEPVVVRSDYTLTDIASLARQQHRDTGRALLGFYSTEFGYTIDLGPDGDKACPALIGATVTLRLQHRLIEIGQEATTNSCAYPRALRHYRRLAEVDEQTVARFSASTAAALTQASSALKQASGPQADMEAVLREQIGAVVDAAIAPLHDARRDAQQAVNNSAELRQLASSCSI